MSAINFQTFSPELGNTLVNNAIVVFRQPAAKKIV